MKDIRVHMETKMSNAIFMHAVKVVEFMVNCEA